jgi:hypothetical protein
MNPAKATTAVVPPHAAPAETDVLGWLLLSATAFTISAFLIHEIYSVDVWWQITIGREILATGAIPFEDRFAVAALGRPYHDSHWLFQLALALSHRVLGLLGAQILMIICWGVTLVFAYKAVRRWTTRAPAAALLFLAAMASVERFITRPEIVTFAGVAVFYYLLQEGRFRSVRDLCVLGILQVAWANSHGLFVVGPFMLACYWAVAALERIRGGARSDFVALSRGLAIVGLATALTPFGLAGWRYAALLFVEAGAAAPEVMRGVGEMAGPFSKVARSSPAFWFYLVLLALAILAAGRSIVRRQLSGRLLILIALGAASLTARRNVVLLALVAAPFVTESLAPLLPRRRGTRRALTLSAAVLMMVWAVFPLSGSFYSTMDIPARWGFGPTPSFFPHQLPPFLDEIGFEGRVLNSNTLGGFYMYHGYPRRLPLIDGRWEVYDPDDLAQLLPGSKDGAAWRKIVDRYEIRGILLGHTSAEASAFLPRLRQAPDWRLVYYDHAASFWMPNDASSPPAVDLHDPSTLPPIRRSDDGLILQAFLNTVGANDLSLSNLERTLRFGVDKKPLLEQLGKLQIQNHRFEAAQRTYEELLSVDPRSVPALNELAFLAYSRGDLQEALALMERLLEIEPDDPQFLENYRRLMDAANQENRDGRR